VAKAERPTTVQWSVLTCEPLPDWVGTTIIFDITSTEDGGSQLTVRHAGLGRLECFDTCNDRWRHYIASLVSYVDHGVGQPRGSAEGSR
jgi:hypothetical protein